MRRTLAWGVALLFFSTPLALGAGELDTSQRYLVLHTSRDSTMRNELNQAANAGYRVLFGEAATGETSLLLEKLATSPDTYQYLLLSTTKKFLTETELNEAAGRGFRVLSQTVFHAQEMLLEKAPGPSPRYHYRVLQAAETSAFVEGLAQAIRDGYEVVGLAPTGERKQPIVVILEKSAETLAEHAPSGGESDPNLLRVVFGQGTYFEPLRFEESGGPRYLLLLLTEVGDAIIQLRLAEVAVAGYRVRVGSASSVSMYLLLEKVAPSPDTYHYWLLATNLTSTMEKELNQVATQGFRLLPRLLARLAAVEMALVMEKSPDSRARYHYRLLATKQTSTLQKEVTQATQEGYQVVAMLRSVSVGSMLFSSRPEHIVILEKAEGPGGR